MMRRLLRSFSWNELSYGFLIYLFTTALLLWPYFPKSLPLHVGDRSRFTILSPRSTHVQTASDRAATEKIREARRATVPPVYLVDEEKTLALRAHIHRVFAALHGARQPGIIVWPEAVQSIPPVMVHELLNLNQELLANVEFLTVLLADRLLTEGIHDAVDDHSWKTHVMDEVLAQHLSQRMTQLVSELLQNLLQPNAFYSPAATARAREEEASKVQDQTTRFREGQPILYKGDPVTEAHIEVLQVMGLIGGRLDRWLVLGAALANALVFLLAGSFLLHFQPRIRQQSRTMFMLAGTLILVLLVANVLLGIPENTVLPGALVLLPVAGLATSLALLLNPYATMLVMTISAIQLCLLTKMDIYWTLYFLISSYLAAFQVKRVVQRNDIMRSGLWLGLFQMAMMMVLAVLLGRRGVHWLVVEPLYGLVSGVLGSFLVLGILPLVELLTGMTTSLRLLELANLNHPLLKRLMLEAPGTYHHSLMVANLAEAGCEAIGRDGLVGRVCGYYHDVGKIKRPNFFVENQFDGINPHDNVTPALSALIITSHTKDGVELGREAKLPQVVLDGMLQHHGTGLVSFFYYKILKQASADWENDEELKNLFRYEGPKPQSKAQGVLMLADSVEASVRSLEKPTPNKVENLIQKIFDARVADEQLDECGLSLRDLRLLRKAFMRVFTGMFHQRVQYPDAKAAEGPTRISLPVRNETLSSGDAAELQRKVDRMWNS